MDIPKLIWYDSYNKYSPRLEGFVMSQHLEGVYWNVGENEYNLQLSFPASKTSYVLEKFEDWSHVAEGEDSKQDKKIIIFRKKFPDRLEMRKLVKDLRYNKILLKEVT